MRDQGESFSYPIELSAGDGGRFESLRALVDPASSYSVVPATILASLGVEPQWTEWFTAADGSRQEMSLAEVRIRVDGRERTIICVFGSPESVPTLGVEPQWTEWFTAADGSRQEMSLAEVRIRVDGRERTIICVFGSPESVPTLGSYALVGLALQADPANRRAPVSALTTISSILYSGWTVLRQAQDERAVFFIRSW